MSHLIRYPRILLLSSSRSRHYPNMLEFAKPDISESLRERKIKELVLIPYAQTDYDSYTDAVKKAIEPWGFNVSGLHTYSNVAEKLKSSRAIFVGEGNTFLLLKALYDYNLIDLIKSEVEKGNLVYIGCGAGATVAGKSIHTTNDMPIVYPPSFLAIGLVNFDINPHYVDTKSDTSMLPTRAERIHEYLKVNKKKHWVVLGLSEGCIFDVEGAELSIRGVSWACMYYGCRGQPPITYNVGSDMYKLLDS